MAVAAPTPRTLTADERALASAMLDRARDAMKAIEDYDQTAVDRLCRAVAWAGGNETTAAALARMSVEESGMGSPEPRRRAKVLGILRDALRQKSVGIIEELPDKGIVKYAKPAGVIASLIPVTSPYVTPVGIAIYALKCKDAVIFSPHPASRKTTTEVVRVMRAALCAAGAPEDLLQVVEKPSIPLAKELMSICDLTIATGGPAMVKAAYGSGKPAYGVGAGNATMVIDETADVAQAARNSAISKTNDHGSGCSADGNLLVDGRIYDTFLEQLQTEGGYLLEAHEKELLRKAYWDAQGHRTANTIARSAAAVAQVAGFSLPAGKTFLIVEEQRIGKQHLFSTEKLGVVMAIFKYHGFDDALDKVRQIFDTGGKGIRAGFFPTTTTTSIGSHSSRRSAE
jgi:sulfoacetaldehyde dehydrogenase